MEQLNSKLYAKYNNLKKRKALVDEEWNHRRDADVSDFQSAVEVVEALKNENDRLRAEMDSLQEQYDDCREMMLEECRKTKQLSDEVGRLQNLLSKKTPNSDNAVRRSPHTSPRVTRSKTKVSASKLAPDSVIRQTEVQDKDSASVPMDNRQTKVVVPDCCRRSTSDSGDAPGEAQGRCVFQTLFELLLGMQFSVDSQSEGPCLSAVHQMSGYTFKLTWLRYGDGDGELRYHVSSLGTLERVALEWMKEDIVFSTSMWPVFFERMSRVIGCR